MGNQGSTSRGPTRSAYANHPPRQHGQPAGFTQLAPGHAVAGEEEEWQLQRALEASAVQAALEESRRVAGLPPHDPHARPGAPPAARPAPQVPLPAPAYVYDSAPQRFQTFAQPPPQAGGGQAAQGAADPARAREEEELALALALSAAEASTSGARRPPEPARVAPVGASAMSDEQLARLLHQQEVALAGQAGTAPPAPQGHQQAWHPQPPQPAPPAFWAQPPPASPSRPAATPYPQQPSWQPPVAPAHGGPQQPHLLDMDMHLAAPAAPPQPSWPAPPQPAPRPPAATAARRDAELARALQQQYNLEQARGSPAAAAQRPAQRPSPGPSPTSSPSSSPAALHSQPAAGRAFTPASPVGGLGGGLVTDPAASSVCPGCSRSIGGFLGALGPHTVALGRRWHNDCLRCSGCGQVLSLGAGTSLIGVGADGMPYHLDCHKAKFHPRCGVCKDFIPVEADGRVRFQRDPFWRERYCPVHASDGTARCCACNRLRPAADQWPQLQDGRSLCSDCVSTLVMDTADCQPLYDELLLFFASMGMQLPSKPPLLLVDSSALNEAETREGRVTSPHSTEGAGHEWGGGGGEAAPMFHTRGLTLSEEYTTVRTVVRNSGRAGWLGVAPQVVHLPGARHCEVTAIMVLYGLPRLLTGSILAHELLHAYLRLTASPPLALPLEEGLAQLLALLWLEAQPAQQPGSWEERLASYLAHQIRSDPSPVYGDGFRAALDAFQRVGLPALLAHVRAHAALPPP